MSGAAAAYIIIRRRRRDRAALDQVSRTVAEDLAERGLLPRPPQPRAPYDWVGALYAAIAGAIMDLGLVVIGFAAFLLFLH